MKRFDRLKAVGAAAAVIVGAAVVLAQGALGGPPGEPVVPAAIKVPDGNKLFLVGRAVGVQIYICGPSASGYSWTFDAPRAELTNAMGKPLATHFRGPTWQARDGSYVVGSVVARVTVDASAIPWLLLSASSAGAGGDGDRLAATTYVQRVATTGGLAPAARTCNASTSGTAEEVPYTADYYFWKRTGN